MGPYAGADYNLALCPLQIRLQHIYHTDKKEKKIFLIYKDIQKEAVAKSYITNGLLIYEKFFAFPHKLGSPSSYMTLQLLSSEFPYI